MINYHDYCMTGEDWRNIPGYEGLYQASNFGRIRSVDGKVTHSNRHGLRRWKGRIIKPKGINYQTGHRVSLWKNKEKKDWLVARLVGITFIPIPNEEEMTINHKDGNRFNNNVRNLEWLTIGDNINHAFDNNLIGTNIVTKLKIDHNVYEFRSMAKASVFLGRSRGYISDCVKNNRVIRDERGGEVKIL